MLWSVKYQKNLYGLIKSESYKSTGVSFHSRDYFSLYNNKINARVLIGQSAIVYCAGKPMEKSRVFWTII